MAPSSSSMPTMESLLPRVLRIDGPMLPHLYHRRRHLPSSSSGANALPAASSSLSSLNPILTPPTVDGDDFRYLLVPESRRIVVRGAQRGTRVCDLVVAIEDCGVGVGMVGGGPIRSVALAWLPHRPRGYYERRGLDDATTADDVRDSASDSGTRMGTGGGGGEWTILAGCAGGIVHEWSVTSLSSSSSSSSAPPSTMRLLPRRSFRLKCGSTKVKDLNHLASPTYSPCDDYCVSSSYMSSSDASAVVYGIIDGGGGRSSGGGDDCKSSPSWLVRFVVPPFFERSRVSCGPQGDGGGKPVLRLLPARKLTLAKGKDRAFGLLAAYRPRSSHSSKDHDDDGGGGGGGGRRDDAFVVMCAPRSIVIYRDRLDVNDVNGGVPSSHLRLVRFDESTTGGGILTCAVVSPGTKDLALGRERGHVDVLHDVFENVSRHLDDVHRSPRDGGKSHHQHHPSRTTVRRTLHWHSHPVRALAYATAGSGGARGDRGRGSSGPASLLSGGEESVLVTWQLERNHHRPSNFVARMGRGGIVSILRCSRTGGVIVFCSDNTVQRFDGVTYDRVWAEHGLASMELHEEEEEARGSEVADGVRKRVAARRGPIIMVRDPITNYPMLTNLPGAPGMVHWYDPMSASVIGTLEVRRRYIQSYMLSMLFF
jgi:hypothetical protein